ncbi:Cloroperoxidase [Aulographum hederae CBS 113979]|uniref:Cloroperoxidase n=1 Tax=Aulographum hederae CBS 113979 TaxID=1176131 RepID=A0A6G1H6P9_9PEZI|nr:Cloroperoxidase [Aulographum hederae CBS 113979]
MFSDIIAIFFILHVPCLALSFDHPVSSSWFKARAEAVEFLDGYPWTPAAIISNVSRSPCPMLNTFSNHGFLPRNGRNITKEDFNEAQVQALHMSIDLANKTTNAMIAKLGSPRNTSASFDLEDFAAHDATDHDASLTRLDVIQGSSIDVNPGLVQFLLDDSADDWIDTLSIGRSRARREAESIAIGSPKLSTSFTRFAQLEASFIVLIFGDLNGNDTDTWRASKDQVRHWLNYERFPVEQGYARSSDSRTAEQQECIISSIENYHNQFVSMYET